MLKIQCNKENTCIYKAKLEKELFAEDFVYHIMYVYECSDFRRCKAALYRPFVYTAFTPNVSYAILHLMRIFHERIATDVDELFEGGMRTSDNFRRYARNLANVLLCDGLDPDVFLKFCVILTCVAAQIYIHNIKQAPEIAILEIEKALMYDLWQGGWDVLERTAQNHAKMYHSLESSLSPESSSFSSDED